VSFMFYCLFTPSRKQTLRLDIDEDDYAIVEFRQLGQVLD
jgi:hypothetical protein